MNNMNTINNMNDMDHRHRHWMVNEERDGLWCSIFEIHCSVGSKLIGFDESMLGFDRSALMQVNRIRVGRDAPGWRAGREGGREGGYYFRPCQIN